MIVVFSFLVVSDFLFTERLQSLFLFAQFLLHFLFFFCFPSPLLRLLMLRLCSHGAFQTQSSSFGVPLCDSCLLRLRLYRYTRWRSFAVLTYLLLSEIIKCISSWCYVNGSHYSCRTYHSRINVASFGLKYSSIGWCSFFSGRCNYMCRRGQRCASERSYPHSLELFGGSLHMVWVMNFLWLKTERAMQSVLSNARVSVLVKLTLT